MAQNDLRNKQLGFYLAGLIEGDGNIWTSIPVKSEKGRIYNPRITITAHIKETPFLQHLKQLLNTGYLYHYKSTNVVKYNISETYKLIEILKLINGKFRTPKIKYLERAIDRVNLLYSANIKILPLDNSDLLNNAWLAGMTDADGNFFVSLEGNYGLNKSLLRGRVKCIFSIKQRVIDIPTGLTCVPFMSEIADLFQCKINYKAGNAMTFFAQADSKHYLTKNYFDKYPLMTTKHLNYLCFIQALAYLGKRLTNQEILEVQTIKNCMNNNRIYFNWDHLKAFYSF